MSTATTHDYITIREAAKLFPGRPHYSTVWRWASQGVRGIKLGHIRIGGQRFTTPQAVEAFITAMNQSDADRLEAEGC